MGSNTERALAVTEESKGKDRPEKTKKAKDMWKKASKL